MLIHDAKYGRNCTDLSVADDNLWRERNLRMCQIIDTMKLDILLSEMVSSGHLNKDMAEIYKTQAASLLAALRSENNRSFKSKDKS